ncbi:MAG: hypothetical protein JO127_02770 [Caulobacteraceae bacterium]|nr:hypothetical protein [Caulobacteraceae bacterium]
MRFLKPLVAGATLVALATPALALADPAFGDRGHEYHRDRGDAGRDGYYGDYGRRDHGFAYRDGWRGDYGYGYGDYGWRHHHHRRYWGDRYGW